MRKRIHKTSLLASVTLLSALTASAQLLGQWDFEAGTLAGTVGTELTFADGLTQEGSAFGTTTALGIPNIGGAEAKVLKFPASTEATMGILMPIESGPIGGDFLNNYTVIMDVLFPAESSSKWRALLQVETTLNEDADFFINDSNGIGIDSSYQGTILPDTWHRIGWVADNETGKIRKYIDGTLVGTQNYGSIDDRYALSPGGTAALFADNDGEAQLGYVNSIQFRNDALTTPQMRAMGAPTATGIPQVIPPIPSGIEKFIPAGEFASRNTSVGAIIALGSTTIEDSSISVSLNGVSVPSPVITRDPEFVTVRSAAQALEIGERYTNVISYTDSIAGAKLYTSVFTAALYFEDFESIVLGPNVEEATVGDAVWTNLPPVGWSINNTNMAGFTSLDEDGDGRPDGDGVTEWFGWSFANRDWWATTAGDQDRTKFTLASGTVAIADPDEWDDATHDQGLFNSVLTTPSISLAGISANSVILRFHSSWRDEAQDDGPPNFPEGNINNQTAVIMASFDGAAPVQILKWDSVATSPTFHDDNANELVTVPINNPAGASNVVLTFSLLEAANDWWWAFDNVVLNAGPTAPNVTVAPFAGWVSVGAQATLSVTAEGTAPLSYQWKFGGSNIVGETSSTLTLTDIGAADAGDYSVQVSNVAGSVDSAIAPLFVYSGSVTNDLVAHLKFDDTLDDASGRANNGTAVGAPDFMAGKVGKAVHIPSGADYVSLAAPTDLNYGVTNDFSFSFWAQVNALDGDPSLIGNKDWNSGANQGYVVFTESDHRVDWNASGPGGARRDGNAVTGALASNTWVHVVLTFDRDGSSVTYVDGERRTFSDISGNPIDVSTPEGFGTNIGQDGTGSYGSFFTDLGMDDLGIWRRVLTADEAKAIYDAAVAGKDLSQAVVSFEEPGDQPQITITRSGTDLVISVAPAGTYQLQKKSSLSDAGWTDVGTAGAGPFTVPADGTAGFFRVSR